MIDKIESVEISTTQCTELSQAFINYSGSFKNDNPVYNLHMEIKRVHTQNVSENIVEMGNSLMLNKEQLNFAEVLAWLHDIGRFEQYDKYKTFSDSESENHAIIGLRVIAQQNLLKDYSVDQKAFISRCIMNHNISAVPENEPPVIDFYSRLLRDADKVDIWRLNLEMNIMNTIRDEKLPVEYNVPQRLLDDFTNKRPIKLEEVKSFYDSILFKLSWVFDLNFRHSFEIFRNREINSKLLSKIPGSDVLHQIEKITDDYVNVKCIS